jgi:serine/threonine-protein kinase RsbW
MKQLILYNKFKSTRKSIDELEQILCSIRKKLFISEIDYYNIYLCIYELFINAVHHGNHIDISKYIELIIEKEDNKLIITTIDQGKGFLLEDIPNPLTIENILKDSGRGIFIMKNYATTINYKHSPRGFCSTITFNI